MKHRISLSKKLGKYIIVCLFFSSFGQLINAQQTYTFSGKVMESNIKQPVIGAAIQIANTTIGGTTDIDGNYNFSGKLKPGKYKINFSFLGFSNKSVDITLGSSTDVKTDVTLLPDLMNLDEVIVTGTSVKTSKKQLGNSISTLSSKDLINSGATGIDQALAGKVSGALVMQNSGDPAGGISIRMRGPSTITGSSDPLYVIDGLIVSNSSREVINLGGNTQNRLVDLNPNDIDRIEILKGAAAAAIYGSRASNGVVQIFTKRGKSGKPSFSFSTNFKINELRKKMDYNEVPLAWVNPGTNTDLTTKPVERYDVQDAIFDTGYGTENFLSVSGGTDNTKYFVSTSFLSNEGIIKNTDFKKFSFTSNIDQKLNSWLKLNFGLTFIQSKSNDIPNGGITSSGGAITHLLFWNNANNPYPDANGNFLTTVGAASPVEDIMKSEYGQRINRAITNIGLTANPFKGFNVNFLAGLDYYNHSGTGYVPIGTIANPTGYASRSDVNSFQYNIDLNASYKFDINENFESTTTAGATRQYENVEQIGLSSDKLAPGVKVATGGTIISSMDSRSEIAMWGEFLQQTFGYKNKLFLTGAIRTDGASVFGPKERNQVYSKVSSAYNISNETFWKNIFGDHFNSLKLRAAWGQAGNLTAIGPFDKTLNYLPISIGGSTGVVPSTLLGNENVKPEKQDEIEFGLDAGFLKNRIGLEFTYYKQKVSDLLLKRELAASSGFQYRYENVGKLENEGIEILLRAAAIDTEDFDWNVTTTYAKNTNIVTKVVGTSIPFPDSFATNFVIEGQPLGVFYRAFYARDANGDIALGTNGLPYGGTNPDGTKSKVIGDPNPEWFGSLINEFKYKNFDFRFQLDAVQGFDVMNWDRRIMDRTTLYGGGYNAGQELLGNLPKGTGVATYGIFEEFVEDGSFVKLREVSLSYTFNPKKSGFQSIRVSLVGRNLVSWDNYSAFDPEVNTTGQSNGTRGFDFAAVPIPRTYQIGVNATF
jgi:TonB-linked SusC/RagA family outer membrane protein